ncbi:13039_t:CDS:2 [Cetraspora pellucida]|uniref:13039_t:CDS:1 n=1 Tax=Cetraspora pellucida TaxID=1433469 RepID=A0A9N9FI33_9GLOM|nr:13039_t:CDS:2 [Cetraspora pellucida]
MTTNATEQVTTSSATSTLISALIFNTAITAAAFITFDLIRKRSTKIFEPKTYLVPERKRAPPVPSGFLKWLKPALMASDEELILRAGLDGYMFLRVIRFFMILFASFSILGIGLILPLNYINQYDKPGLESFTIGNVKDRERLYVHVITCYIFTAAILYTMYREYYLYVRLRHESLTTPEHRISARATTILVVGIPEQLNNEEDLTNLFSVFPGGVKRVWINREPSRLVDLTVKRMNLIHKLECAETDFLLKYLKNLAKDGESEQDVEDGNKVPASLRPIHRTIPLIGKKVDSIETYREEIQKLNGEINEWRQKINSFKKLKSAFIQFNDYVGAQLAATLTIPRLTEISREDVIWENLNIPRIQRAFRKVVSTSVTTALIILWIIPVLFVASISTLSQLEKVIPFLTPLVNKLPAAAIGIIQGILPAIGLAILMMNLPVILRALSKFEGFVRHSAVSLSLQEKYFFFLLINVLLVTTSANGAFQALPEIIRNPTSIVSSLAQNLPLASTFFLTYVLLSLSAAAFETLQIGTLAMYLLSKILLVKTPRQILQLETSLTSKDWGVTFPPHILMASIGLVYSVIQPLILPLATLHFALFYVAYRYNFLYVYEQVQETNGVLFLHAMKQFYWGILIFQLTMIGLMFLNEAFVAGVLSVILFVITLGVILGMRNHFSHNPKAEFLPVDLMGIIDIKTRKVIIDTEHFTKSISTVTEEVDDEKADHEFIGSTSKQVSEKPTEVYDEDTDQNEVHIKHGELEKESANTYIHPALIVNNPIVWIPEDSAEVYIEEVRTCRESGLNATSRGATISENYKIKVDITEAPNLKDELYAESSDIMLKYTANVTD